MDRKTFRDDTWEWVFVDAESSESVAAARELPDVNEKWFDSVDSDKIEPLQMDTSRHGEEVMWGALIYYQDAEDQSKKTVLHYSLSRNRLMTTEIDFSMFKCTMKEELLERMEDAENAIEGFMMLVGEVLSSFLLGIDEFEDQLQDLLWDIKKRNNEDVLDEIMDRRHESLVWINLIVPVSEIRRAVVEAFDGDVQEGRHYRRAERRILRAQELIEKYDDEIGEMIDLETVISSHRGNEIVKTLTIITVLFTPVMAWGAIWAMRFESMPEVKWEYGYLFALLVIALSTLAVYVYLKKKNSIGSVLKKPKDKKF